jgi:hypothetical protein
MTRKERERFSRLFGLIEAVPFPHDGSGTKSASAQGMVDYQADMRDFRAGYHAAFYAVMLDGQESAEMWGDYDHPDLLLDALEAWVEARKAEQWEKPYLDWAYFYHNYRVEHEQEYEKNSA